MGCDTARASTPAAKDADCHSAVGVSHSVEASRQTQEPPHSHSDFYQSRMAVERLSRNHASGCYLVQEIAQGRFRS